MGITHLAAPGLVESELQGLAPPRGIQEGMDTTHLWGIQVGITIYTASAASLQTTPALCQLGGVLRAEKGIGSGVSTYWFCSCFCHSPANKLGFPF